MSSNISVAITAETADLQAKLALAQSNLRAFSTETRSAADALRLAGAAANDDMKGGLDQAASSMARAKAEVTSLKTALGEAGGAQGWGGLRERIINGNIAIRDSIGAFSELGAAIGAVFVGERIFGAVERTAELGASLLKLSKETGVAVETLSGWHYAADQMGVSADSLDTGLVRLGRNIQAALITPTSQAAQAFQTAGISQDFLRKNSNDYVAVLMRLADAFHEHADGAQADAIAMALLGRAGAELVPFLREGSGAIEEMVQRQKALGDQMTTGMAEAMEKHRQAVKDLTAAWNGFEIELTNKVMPALTGIAQGLTTALAGASVGVQIKSTEDQLDGLKARLAELQNPAGSRRGGGGSQSVNQWWSASEIKYAEDEIDKLSRKLAYLKSQGAAQGGASSEILSVPSNLGAVQGGAGAGAGGEGGAGAGAAGGAGGEGGAGAGAGGAGGKPAFGDLSQPVAELEKFRAKLDDVKLALQQQGASAQDVLLREAELWRQEASAAGLTAQEVIQARQQLDTTWSQLLKQKAAEAKAEADQETRAAKQAADEQTRDMTTNYRQQMELVKSDNDEALAAIKAAHSTSRADELQAEAAYWRQIIAMTRAGTQQQIEAIKSLATVTQQITTEQAATWQQAERQLTESFTGPATRAFDTMVSGMFNRTQSWSQTTKKAFDQMAESFIEDVAKMIAKWLAFQALTAMGSGGSAVASAFGMTGGPLQTLFGGIGGAAGGASSASTTAAIATQTATLTANTTAQTAALTASTTAQTAALSAAQTAALTASDTAQTAALAASVTAPIVAAIATETTTLGALLTLLNAKPSVFGTSYDSGTMSVPHDMMAMVHQDEIIVPAGPSSLIRSGAATLGGPGGSGGSSLGITVAPQIYAMDARSITQSFTNNPVALRSLANAIGRYLPMNPSVAF